MTQFPQPMLTFAKYLMACREIVAHHSNKRISMYYLLNTYIIHGKAPFLQKCVCMYLVLTCGTY